jgi:polyhydroxyalkanoate synthesis regulator phasin
VSPALEALVGQLLSKRAEARPASADEVEERLTASLPPRDGAGLAATAVLVATGVPMETRTTEQAATRPYPTAPRPAEIADPRPREVQPAGSAQPRPRSWWLIAATLLAGVVLAAALLAPLLSRGTTGAPEPSAPRTPSILATPSAPATAASPKTTPQVSATRQPTSPLANVRAVVDALVAEGQMDPRRAEEFGHRLDDFAKMRDEGHKGAGKRVDELSKYLTKLVKSGELTPDGFRRIEAALARV